MINNPTADYNFAGLGFTALSLDVRDPSHINQGAITNQSFTQQLSNISFNNSTGAISFAVAQSPELVRNIQFTGTAFTDSSGQYVVGFTGTWTGQRILLNRSAHAARREGTAHKGAAFQIQPPNNSLNVEGYWSATLGTEIQ